MCIRLSVPESDSVVRSDDVAIPPDIVEPTAKRFNGRFELRFVFTTPSIAADGEAHWAGRAVIDNTTVANLGPLQLTAVVSAILLETVPSTIRLEVYRVESPAIHPCEQLLVDHCHAVLKNDEFRGSVSSSHLQNQVRELPFYGEVIGRTRSVWTEFIMAHTDRWNVFRYTQEEIDVNCLGSTCRTKEQRLYAWENAEVFRAGDIAREKVRQKAEADVDSFILERLSVRPYEQSELLELLIEHEGFIALITPNIMKILALYESQPQRYFVLKDPYHPILIEPRRTATAPALRFDRVTRTMVPKTAASTAPSTVAKSLDTGDTHTT